MSFWYKFVLYKKLGQSFKSPLNKETEVCSVLSLPCLPLELQYNQTAQAGKRKGERGWEKNQTRESRDRNKSILFAPIIYFPLYKTSPIILAASL